MGNLTQTPEIRKTPQGKLVTELNLAMNRGWTDQQGQRQTDTTYVNVTVWGRAAENAVKFLEKGRSVLVEGRLHTDVWQDNTTGKQRSRLMITADLVQYLGTATERNAAAA